MARQLTDEELKKVAGGIQIDDSLLQMFLGYTWEELGTKLEPFLVSASAAGLDKDVKLVRGLLESKDINPAQAILYMGSLGRLKAHAQKENFTDVAAIFDSILNVYSQLA